MKRRAISALLLLLLAVSKSAPAEQYPETLIIQSVSDDIVTCTTWNGARFVFKSSEGYTKDSVLSAIIDDNGTPERYDDYLIVSKYSGYLYR